MKMVILIDTDDIDEMAVATDLHGVPLLFDQLSDTHGWIEAHSESGCSYLVWDGRLLPPNGLVAGADDDLITIGERMVEQLKQMLSDLSTRIGPLTITQISALISEWEEMRILAGNEATLNYGGTM